MIARPVVVLCIEDDADIREIVRLALALDDQITLLEAASAHIAGELITVRAQDIDLILVDDGLPDCCGCDLVSLMQRACPRSPIIFFTAACNGADIDRYRSSGAAGIICKPFDPLTFSQHVRSALDHAGDFFTIN